MANVNSSAGWSGLPAQSITTTSATALLVPAAGLYATLPNQTMAAGTGLFISPVNNAQTSNPYAATVTYVNDSVDGKQFKVRVVGLVTVGAASTFVAGLYLGTSATLASDTLLAATTSYSITGAGTVNFVAEWNFIWDSTSTKLNGTVSSLVNDVWTAPAAITQATVTDPTTLKFIPAFTFGTANASNTVTVKEFLFENE